MKIGAFLLLTLTIASQAFAQAGVLPGVSLSTVVQVEVRGNARVPADQILAVVSTKIGETVDQAKLKQDAQSIYDLGYFTDVKAETLKVEKGIGVVFLVTENPAVSEVEITGASMVPVSKLRSLMKTSPGKILNTRTLYGDVLAINEYYENLGYNDPANHVVDLSWAKDGSVVLKIQDGIVIKVIQINGNSVYPAARLRGLIQSSPGEVFNKLKMQADLGRIADLYKFDNFVLAGLKGNIQPDGTVVVDVTETVVQAMRVEGNTKTKDYVIFRAVRTKVGEVMNSKRVQKDRENLQNTGYFEEVNVEPEEGTEPGKVVLVWKVKEQKTGTASVGLGYAGAAGADRAGLTGAVSVAERNIKGTGQSAAFQWQRGIFVNSLSLSYQNPWIDRHEDSLAVSFFNSQFYNQAQVVSGFTNNPKFNFYNDQLTGGTISGGRPVFDEDTHFYLTGKAESISANGIETQLPNGSLVTTNQTGTVRSLAWSGVRDTRDDVFDTSKGRFYSLSVEHAGAPFGGSFDYNKYQEDVRFYFPVHYTYTLAFHVLTGLGYGNVPITDWYILGGPDTLRGFDLDRFIGNRMFLGQAEFRFPLGKQKTFKGAFFYDTGNSWQPGQPISFRDLPKDYGVGIRLRLPNLGLGIVRLDFALGGEGTRTAIGIGQSF